MNGARLRKDMAYRLYRSRNCGCHEFKFEFAAFFLNNQPPFPTVDSKSQQKIKRNWFQNKVNTITLKTTIIDAISNTFSRSFDSFRRLRGVTSSREANTVNSSIVYQHFAINGSHLGFVCSHLHKTKQWCLIDGYLVMVGVVGGATAAWGSAFAHSPQARYEILKWWRHGSLLTADVYNVR